MTNLLSFYTRLKGVQYKDGWVDAVYLDIKILLTKFHTKNFYGSWITGGLRGKILEWMEDYLKNREMRTVIRNTVSIQNEVTSGVQYCIAQY